MGRIGAESEKAREIKNMVDPMSGYIFGGRIDAEGNKFYPFPYIRPRVPIVGFNEELLESYRVPLAGVRVLFTAVNNRGEVVDSSEEVEIAKVLLVERKRNEPRIWDLGGGDTELILRMSDWLGGTAEIPMDRQKARETVEGIKMNKELWRKFKKEKLESNAEVQSLAMSEIMIRDSYIKKIVDQLEAGIPVMDIELVENPKDQ
ncbi:MAG TPA: hypothetical protein VF828_00585 [Patescibacteria group bacterium]